MGTLRAHDPPPIVAELAAADAAGREAILDDLVTPITTGPLTTFLHAGTADRVDVRHFMARFPGLPQMQRIGDDLHSLTVRLPRGARVEYKLAVTKGAKTAVHVDPRNPNRATDPFGANSVAAAPGYRAPWWATHAPERPGRLRRGYVESEAFDKRRALHWYHPAESSSRSPLVVVLDGSDFIHHASIVEVVDNLIAARVLPPVMMALIDPGDRLVEYTDDLRHARFIREVAAAAVRRQGAAASSDHHVYVGASMGAVAALSSAWTTEPVGGLVLLSGSFVTALGGPQRRGKIFEPVIDFMERFAADPGRPAARIFQACGTYEGLASDNRAFTPMLRETGASLLVEEHRDGHHWHNWRDRLGAALAHTVPGADPSRLGSVRP